MTVHVGEVHTDVVPAAGGAAEAGSAAAPAPERLGEREDAWRAARSMDEMMCRRIAAEGFDD